MEEFKPHRQAQKYKSEEDRRKGRLFALHKYNTKKVRCKVCNVEFSCANKLAHERTKKHQYQL